MPWCLVIQTPCPNLSQIHWELLGSKWTCANLPIPDGCELTLHYLTESANDCGKTRCILDHLGGSGRPNKFQSLAMFCPRVLPYLPCVAMFCHICLSKHSHGVESIKPDQELQSDGLHCKVPSGRHMLHRETPKPTELCVKMQLLRWSVWFLHCTMPQEESHCVAGNQQRPTLMLNVESTKESQWGHSNLRAKQFI